MNRSISTQQKERAAQLLAQGRFSVAQIAEKCGVSDRTVFNWQKNEKFAARVKEIVDAFAADSLKFGLAVRANRILELQKHYNGLEEILDNRRARADFSFVPNYDSGYIVITEIVRAKEARGAGTTTNAGDGLYRVKCQVDNSTINTMTSILDQIASEVGHKVSKTEVSLPKRIEDLSDEELVSFAKRLGIAGAGFDKTAVPPMEKA